MTEIVKLLGVHLDDKLSWSEHISFLNKRFSSTRYASSVLISVSNKISFLYVCKNVYCTHAYSTLIYGITLWRATAATQTDFIRQKPIIRNLVRSHLELLKTIGYQIKNGNCEG